MRLTLAVGLLLCSVDAVAQVSVVEPATRAVLVDGHTTISLALRNDASRPLDVRIRLRWLSPAGVVNGETSRDAALPRGESAVSITHPLCQECEPMAERLEYTVYPGARNYNSFAPFTGMLSFPRIADYAFTLGVLTAGIPRPNRSFEVRVLAANPLTGRPVAGVTVEAGKSSAVTDQDGVALLRVQREADDDDSIDVTAKIGDLTATGSAKALPMTPDTIYGYTDKPIYQPGQTIHVRILAVGGDGNAKAGEDYEIRILNDSNDLLFNTQVTTSRFGVASTDWEIPDNAESGLYTIALKTGETDRYYLRNVNIRRYELPSFRVTAAPDRPFYLPGQTVQVEVRGEYLFGKPVTGGKVRITEADDDEKNVAEGTLDANGRCTVTVNAKVEIDEDRKFEDLHFIAFLTDPSTNRTEQRKFDVRISHEPVHIYAVRMESNAAGRRLYVTTYSPDGTPLRSDVEVANEDAVLGKGTTNRFGVTRIDLPPGDDQEDMEARVKTADGLRSRLEFTFQTRKAGAWLRTARTLHRVGEPVKCTIGSAVPDRSVLLIASNERDEVVYTKSVRLTGGQAEVEIPYDKRFGRALNIGVASGAESQPASRRVYFPGPSDLSVKAAPAKAEYRPGDTATIQFQASAEAALGIAVVDQSVLERAATDSAFGRRGWFQNFGWGGAAVGGIAESDLLNLDPAKFDGDLQLIAELLSPDFGPFINNADDPLEEAAEAFATAGQKVLAPVVSALDKHYLETLEFPRDEAAFQNIAGYLFLSVLDPWLQPFHTRFSIERADAVVSFVSAGPDKKFGTADDFEVLSVRRKWFAEYASLIRQALRPYKDYPASPEEFLRVMESAGIRFEALRDPWGGAMRVKLAYSQRTREFEILSAGPDRKFDTEDDFQVAEFGGSYFAATEAAIDRILKAAPEFPRTEEEFRALLLKSAVDLDSLRDPWGHAYYLAFRDEDWFSDNVQQFSYAEFGGAEERRKQVTPIKVTSRMMEIRSIGQDGVKGTYDDFAVATLRRFLRTPQPAQPPLPEKAAQPAVSLGGTGSIAGKVTDQSGAAVPSVEVRLDDQYVARTNLSGEFAFRGLPPGRYRLSCSAAGFQKTVLDAIPVADGKVTRADLVLQLGTVTETVAVEASPVSLQTESASISSVASPVTNPLSTPRVREYFPETLYWQPELVTDAAGRASVRVKLADSVTTWHVAVIGSTVDGRIAEGSADIRAFQPFLADLDVPQMLTAGDEISLPVPVRNYLDRAQKVSVTAQMPPELRLLEAVRQPGVVAPSSSGNAVLTVRAEAAAKRALVRVTAVGGSASDAIEKPTGIHPDGERRQLAVSAVVESGHGLPLAIPAGAIAGSIHGEVKIYPGLLARILEAMEVLLERPYGCGEQTISSTYPNLLLLRALKQAGIEDELLRARAMKNLLAGYQRLLRYQDDGGGFTYWGHGDADLALTAYALTFLTDAQAFISVDEDRVAKARQWLAKQTAADPARAAVRMRALAHTRLKGAEDPDLWLGELARKAAEFGDPYAMATFALAAIEANKPELAGPTVDRLRRLAQDERGAAYWALRANTPYHGWGRSGQVETTALVVSALARWRKAGHTDAALDTLIDRGALFLLHNADAGGAWGTSQATVGALTALLDTWSNDDGAKATQVEVRVNGASAGKVTLPAGRAVRAPLVMDVSRLMRAGANEVTLAGFEPRALQVQLTGVWYEAWVQKRPARDFDMQVRFSALTAAVNQAVECDVTISRPAFRGYGMMIAEVGLPPGAEVDRGVLEELIDNWKNGVDSYEVSPDHVTFYVWPRASDVKFSFPFRPRYAMKARAAQSVLYDYYNPDERVVLVPERFVVR